MTRLKVKPEIFAFLTITAMSSVSLSAHVFSPRMSGKCGGANNTSVSSLPVSNLCSVGSASAVTGSGPFKWTCSGSGGGASASCSAQLAAAPAPSVSLTANPSTISAGQSSILSYSSTNATSCSGYGYTTSATSGSGPVSPTVTTTFTLTCSGPGGSASASTTVTVGAQPTATPVATATPAQAVFNWKPLKVGAGGFVRGFDIAADGTQVGRTDTYGAYLWNGSTWQQLVSATSLPSSFLVPGKGTGVYEIKIAPSNTNIFYMEYLGYVFASANRGTTWTQTAFAQVSNMNPNDSYAQNGQKMAVDPSNSNVVYAGTAQNGLFVTVNGGASWQSVAAIPASKVDSSGNYPGISGIVFNPNSGTTSGLTNTIFAASYGNGVYQSTNGGASWSLLAGSPTSVQFAALSSTGVYYATSDNGSASSLWSYSGGVWTQLISTYSGDVHSVAVNPSNPLEVVVQSGGGSLNVSYDGGKTWSGFTSNFTMVANDIPWLATTSTFMTVGATVFNPKVANQLISSAGVGVWATSLPTSGFTSNSPITWTSQSAGIEQLVAVKIVVPTGGHPVLGSWDRPFFYVNNPSQYPATYAPNTGGVLSQGWSIDFAATEPSFVVGLADYAYTGQEFSSYSTNSGQTWTSLPSYPAGFGAGGIVGGTMAVSTSTNFVWAPADGNQPYYTLNGGATWSPVTLPGVTSWGGFDWAYYFDVRTVAADRAVANVFYLYYPGQGVFVTTNGGVNWSLVFSGEIAPDDYYSSEFNSVPGVQGNLFLTAGPQSGTAPGNNPFMRSVNGGATWTPVPNVEQVYCYGFGAPKVAGGYPAIYIVGWVNNVYGIWRSDDNAQTWNNIGTWPLNILDSISTISGDPVTYGEVYVGFGGAGYAYYGP